MVITRSVLSMLQRSDNYDKKPRIDTTGDYVNTTTSGVYQINYFATDQSGNKSKMVTRIVSIKSAVGIATEDNALNAINIYPNPGSGKFLINIKMKGSSNASLEVYDALGRHLQGMTYSVQNGTSLVLHLEDRASGVYFLKLRSKEFTVSARLLITQ